MAIEPRDQLKTYFETGDIPTQYQFDAVLDSYIHKTDDGVTIYNLPSSTEKYFGINTLIPEGPLGITAMSDDDTLASFNKSGDTTATWFFNLNPTDGVGFNIDQSLVSGRTSRFFISEASGAVGIGTTTPTQKLEIEASSGNNVTALRIVNTATVANNGFILGHEHNAQDKINGSFSISENEFSQNTKRMVVIPGGNVGVNILEPDTKLHIGGDLNSPAIDLDLIEGTGLVTVGPMEANLVFDYEGVQARVGNYVGTVLDITASTLNLQRLGGDVLFYGDDSFDDTDRTILTEGSYLGIGNVNPTQRIDVAGAIRIQSTDKEYDGSIRYTGSDFEGFMSGTWHSFTSGGGGGGGPWVQEDSVIYYVASHKTFVGIGTDDPSSTLDVEDLEQVTGGNVAVSVLNKAVTTAQDIGSYRVGLEIKNDGDWGNPKGRDIGLYIATVNGNNKTPDFNIAAVMNGNVMIGEFDQTKKFLGTGAKNVLSIQDGAEPAPNDGTISTQLYAISYNGHAGTFHVLNGNGDRMRFYREDALTPADESTISPDIYGATEAGVIENLRTRIDELEQRLINFGLL